MDAVKVLIFDRKLNEGSIVCFTVNSCGYCYEAHSDNKICKVLNLCDVNEKIQDIQCIKEKHMFKAIKDYFL